MHLKDVRRGVLPGQKRQGLGPTAAACLRAESTPSPLPLTIPRSDPSRISHTRKPAVGLISSQPRRRAEMQAAVEQVSKHGAGSPRNILAFTKAEGRLIDVVVSCIDLRAPSLRMREPETPVAVVVVWRGHVSYYVGGWGLLSGSAGMHRAVAECKFQCLAMQVSGSCWRRLFCLSALVFRKVGKLRGLKNSSR